MDKFFPVLAEMLIFVSCLGAIMTLTITGHADSGLEQTLLVIMGASAGHAMGSQNLVGKLP